MILQQKTLIREKTNQSRRGTIWSKQKAISSSNDIAYSEDESLREADFWSNASLDEEDHAFDLIFLY
jgi:hypothetical protein